MPDARLAVNITHLRREGGLVGQAVYLFRDQATDSIKPALFRDCLLLRPIGHEQAGESKTGQERGSSQFHSGSPIHPALLLILVLGLSIRTDQPGEPSFAALSSRCNR